jgi:peptidoglycan/LPS O-acetylase OafA/YrhL
LTLTQAWTLSRVSISDTTLLNNPSWSLSTEAFFYLSFPLIIWAAVRLPVRALLTLAFGVWALLLVPQWLVAAHLAPTAWTLELVYKNPLFRLNEFVVGVAFGLWYLRRPAWAREARLSWLLVGLLFASLAFGLRVGVPRLLLIDGLLAPVFAALLVTLGSGTGPARWLTAKPLVALGEASYAMYMLHYPVALYLVELGLRVGSATHFVATTAATILVSLLAYRFVEDPARRWLRGVSVRVRPAPAGD